MAEIHYVYELKRITPGPGPSRYIGVRTAANSEPENENTGNKRGHGSAGSTGLKMGQSC